MDEEETDAFGLPLTFSEDVSWLRTLRADYANLVAVIVDNDYLEVLVSSWDQDAHEEALARTLKAIEHLERMFPFDPAAQPMAFDFEDLVSTRMMKDREQYATVTTLEDGFGHFFAEVEKCEAKFPQRFQLRSTGFAPRSGSPGGDVPTHCRGSRPDTLMRRAIDMLWKKRILDYIGKTRLVSTLLNELIHDETVKCVTRQIPDEGVARLNVALHCLLIAVDELRRAKDGGSET